VAPMAAAAEAGWTSEAGSDRYTGRIGWTGQRDSGGKGRKRSGAADQWRASGAIVVKSPAESDRVVRRGYEFTSSISPKTDHGLHVPCR
jgi:hypothetical protein